MPIGRKQDTSVLAPNLGLYLDRPPLLVPERALRDCLNVRIANQTISRANIGYGPFPDGAANPINLDGRPVTLIDNFFPRAGGQFLLFGNTTDLFLYDEANELVEYLTPRYQTGTVDVTNASAVVTGTGTSWSTELKADDYIHIGAIDQIDPAATWYQIDTVDSDTQVTLTAAYTGATDTGLAYTARKNFTGDEQDFWETAIFFSGANHTVGADGDRWYATNGRDRPVAWDGVDDQVYEPDFGDNRTCRSFAVIKNILMLISLTKESGDIRPFSVATSAIGEPENMVTLEAAEFVAHSGADPLQTAFPLGESLALYGERSITMVQYVGPPVQFVFRVGVDGVGPRSGRGIADFGDYHRFLGYDGQYDFDGIGVQEINSHVWREVIRSLSPVRFNLINSHFDEERGELHWIIPLNSDPSDSPEISFVEHYLEDPGDVDLGDVYAKREVPATAWGFFERVDTLTFDQMAEAWEDQNYQWNDQFFQAAFPFNLFGTLDGNIYILGTRDSADGVEMESYARFGRRPIGSIRTKGMLRRVYPMVNTLPSADHDLTVNIYTADLPGGQAVLEHTEGYPLNQAGNHFLSPRLMARYFELEFRTSQAGHIWTLLGYEVDATGGGER